MRLIPWAGVAARLSTTAPPELTADGDGDGTIDGKERPSLVRGAAYCFLPLPVVTGLPIHVNGYFELSSNRRVNKVQLSTATVRFSLLSELLKIWRRFYELRKARKNWVRVFTFLLLMLAELTSSILFVSV